MTLFLSQGWSTAAGAAGLPGDPALEVKGQGPAAATTPPPAEVVSTALDCRWSRSLVRTQISSTYSKGTHIHTHILILLSNLPKLSRRDQKMKHYCHSPHTETHPLLHSYDLIWFYYLFVSWGVNDLIPIIDLKVTKSNSPPKTI